MNASEMTPPPTLSGRLNRLFEVHRPPRAARAWTNREVVAACKAAGWELSESHLSELRRGVKQNPTVRTLGAIASFFEVPVGYFTDEHVAAEVEKELAAREASVRETLAAARAAEEELHAASAALKAAMRKAGVTKLAHRGHVSAAREKAAMMRALARALREDDEDEDEGA